MPEWGICAKCMLWQQNSPSTPGPFCSICGCLSSTRSSLQTTSNRSGVRRVAGGPSAGRDRVPVPRPRDCSRSRACLSRSSDPNTSVSLARLCGARGRAPSRSGPANACALRLTPLGGCRTRTPSLPVVGPVWYRVSALPALDRWPSQNFAPEQNFNLGEGVVFNVQSDRQMPRETNTGTDI
jgi:hypothetical protein